jgi:hypothetical protein
VKSWLIGTEQRTSCRALFLASGNLSECVCFPNIWKKGVRVISRTEELNGAKVTCAVKHQAITNEYWCTRCHSRWPNQPASEPAIPAYHIWTYDVSPAKVTYKTSGKQSQWRLGPSTCVNEILSAKLYKTRPGHDGFTESSCCLDETRILPD